MIIMDKVKILMIGAGNIANTHLDSYSRNDEVEIAAICDINESRLNETADIFGIEKRFTSVDEMLKSVKGDATSRCLRMELQPCRVLDCSSERRSACTLRKADGLQHRTSNRNA